MIMQAQHHAYGSGCIPHRISMTKRWGPVGFMRVGGMGLGAAIPSPVGFADFASFQNAVIASQPTCPPPFDPVCENPRDATISNALAQWSLNPQSCHNVVCDASGNPVTTPPPAGTGSGFQTTTGFVPVSSRSSGTVPVHVRTPWQAVAPPPAPPQQSNVVNPSPSTQLTSTGSSTVAPGSVVSQTNGAVVSPGITASTVGGTVSTTTTDTSGDIISGLPNWVLFAGGAVVVFLLAKVK